MILGTAGSLEPTTRKPALSLDSLDQTEWKNRRCHSSLDLSPSNVPDPDSDFTWCKSLFEDSHGSSLKPYLLDLFGYWKSSNIYFALMGRHTDHLRKLKGVDAWTAFFPLKQATHDYLLVTNTGTRNLGNATKAYDYASNAADTFLLFALDLEVRKVRRVSWSRGSEQEQETPNSLSTRSSIFQHDLGKFRYAGRLKKSSFSPYLPYTSVLTEKLSKIKTRTVVTLQSELDTLVQVMQRFLQKQNRPLISMILHVLESSECHFFLVNVSDVLWSGQEGLILSPRDTFIALPLTKSLERMPTRSITKKRILRNTMKVLNKQIARVPFVDTNEIQRKNIEMYESTFSTSKNLYSGYESPPQDFDQDASIVHSLNEIAQKYDSQKNQLKEYKANRNQLELTLSASLQGGRFKELVAKAYLQCAKDEVLERFFSAENVKGMQHLSEQFHLAVTTPKNYYLSRRIHNVHQNFAISFDTFQRFVEAFRNVLRENGVSEEDEATVLTHMLKYKNDVISQE